MTEYCPECGQPLTFNVYTDYFECLICPYKRKYAYGYDIYDDCTDKSYVDRPGISNDDDYSYGDYSDDD